MREKQFLLSVTLTTFDLLTSFSSSSFPIMHIPQSSVMSYMRQIWSPSYLCPGLLSPPNLKFLYGVPLSSKLERTWQTEYNSLTMWTKLARSLTVEYLTLFVTYVTVNNWVRHWVFTVVYSTRRAYNRLTDGSWHLARLTGLDHEASNDVSSISCARHWSQRIRPGVICTWRVTFHKRPFDLPVP